MPREVVEFRENRSGLGLDDGFLGVCTGERTDRVDRVPERDGQEFGAPALRPSEQTGAAMARDTTQTRKHPCGGVSLISVGISGFRRAAP
ncbi:MAG TPA: hypothetical protein VN823_26205 [Stellaceae bacterium]|nr:hypothetical protein [Stellaceae bacterium]